MEITRDPKTGDIRAVVAGVAVFVEGAWQKAAQDAYTTLGKVKDNVFRIVMQTVEPDKKTERTFFRVMGADQNSPPIQGFKGALEWAATNL